MLLLPLFKTMMVASVARLMMMASVAKGVVLLLQDALEKKVEELTRQLADEKQSSRRSVAKLQREVARLKSERSYAQVGRETCRTCTHCWGGRYEVGHPPCFEGRGIFTCM